MSRLLGLAGLFILTRELTKGVSPESVGPSPPTNGKFGIDDTESEATRFAREKAKQEAARKEAEAKRKLEQERERLLAEARFQAEQRKIRNNPPDCGPARRAFLLGNGTRDNPYRWECRFTGIGI
tara:strand:+ start:291 stop:665 length:375 start_codon:yes stop_codon:yes gene_type:complete